MPLLAPSSMTVVFLSHLPPAPPSDLSPCRNVPLIPGAVAQLWAGQRGGHFRTLSASASLAWSPTVTTSPALQPGDDGRPASAAPVTTTAIAIEQSASIGMAAPRTLQPATAQQAAAKPAMVPILNFTAPPNFNPKANQVVMWLSGQWDSAANSSTAAAAAPAAAGSPVGGVALMRHGQVLAYTFPSDEAKAQGGTFFYGAVWKNIGLPVDGGVVEVWAGAQGGAFKGLKVNITLKWTPGSDDSVLADPAASAAQPVTGNPLGGDDPLVAQPVPSAAPSTASPAASPVAAPTQGGAKAGGGVDGAAATPPPRKPCKLKLRPWAQCGELER
jgi:hypothetical protein